VTVWKRLSCENIFVESEAKIFDPCEAVEVSEDITVYKLISPKFMLHQNIENLSPFGKKISLGSIENPHIRLRKRHLVDFLVE